MIFYNDSYITFVTFAMCNCCSMDFPSSYQNWEVTDPFDLFEAPVLKSESNPKVYLTIHAFIFFSSSHIGLVVRNNLI